MSFFTPFARAARGLAPAVSGIVQGVGQYGREEEATWRLFVGQSKAWQNQLTHVMAGSGVAVAYRSVFCHQKPRVTFSMPGGGTTARELGDALLVFSFEYRGEIRRTALLLQAKRTSQPASQAASQIAAREPGQWHLYTCWPPFTHGLDATGQQPKKFGPSSRPLSRARHLLLRDGNGSLAAAVLGVPTLRRGRPLFFDARSLGDVVESCLGGKVAQQVTNDLSDPQQLASLGASDWSVVVASVCTHVAHRPAGAYANPTNPDVSRAAGRLLSLALPSAATMPVTGVTATLAEAPETSFSVVSIAIGTDPRTIDFLADEVVGRVERRRQ